MTQKSDEEKLDELYNEIEKNIGDMEIHDYMILESIKKWIDIMQDNVKETETELEQMDADDDEYDINSTRLKIEIEYLYRAISKWTIFVKMLCKGSSQKLAYEHIMKILAGNANSYKTMVQMF